MSGAWDTGNASRALAGGNDIVARLMGQWLTERLGQSFVIENLDPDVKDAWGLPAPRLTR